MDGFWCVNIVWHEPILEQFEEFEVNPKEPKVKWLQILQKAQEEISWLTSLLHIAF